MDAPDPSASQPILHAVLVCRGIDTDATGEITLRNVVEVVPAEAVPGEVGPLCFVAFVRGLPAGPGRGAFLLGSPDGTALGRLPLDVEVPAGFQGRQLALHVRLASLPVEQGGWFEVGFEWDGRLLGANRFAVGARGGAGQDVAAE